MAASHGLEVRSEEGQGPTPLMCAASLGDTEILATLLNKGADRTQRTVMVGGRSTSPHATAKPSVWTCFSRPVPRRTCRTQTAKQRWMWQKVKPASRSSRRPAAPRGPHVGPRGSSAQVSRKAFQVHGAASATLRSEIHGPEFSAACP